MTMYVEERFEDIWAAQYIDVVKSNREKYWPSKDSRTCAESHLLQCNKFAFLEDAILSNPFKTSHFGWIDSNLHLDNTSTTIKICEDYTSNMIPAVLNQIKDDKFHIQILNVNDRKYLLKENKREFYQHCQWVVCGCFFVCGPEIGLKILNRLKENVVQTTLDGYGHGEEMIFLEILDEFPDDIVPSYGDYHQIINNFIHPTQNIQYIVDFILVKYYYMNFITECIACCQSILYSYDNYILPMDYNIYMKIISFYSMSLTKFIQTNPTNKIQINILENLKRKVSKLCNIDANAFIASNKI